jgi:hypothetical protein
MSESFFSVFILALPVLVIALYYLFFKKVKEERRQDYGKPLFYFLLIVSAILVIWGIISIIMALIGGMEIKAKPTPILFVTSILALAASLFDLSRKKKWPQYSWFIPYFGLLYSSALVIWGIVSIILTRVTG